MNTIRTVADLARVIAVYDQNLRIEPLVLDGITVKPASLNNDNLICHVNRSALGEDDSLQISVVVTSPRFERAPLSEHAEMVRLLTAGALEAENLGRHLLAEDLTRVAH
jgi:hypothetical protein